MTTSMCIYYNKAVLYSYYSSRSLLCGGEYNFSVDSCALNLSMVVSGCPNSAEELAIVSVEDIDFFDCPHFGLCIRGRGIGKLEIVAFMLFSCLLTVYLRMLRSILRILTMPVSRGVSGLRKAWLINSM